MTDNTLYGDSPRIAPSSALVAPFAVLARKALSRLSDGTIRLTESGRTEVYGRGDPEVHVEVRDPRFYRRLVTGGSVGAGESYMDGEWSCDDLVSLIRIFARNRDALAAVDGAGSQLLRWANRSKHLLRRNTRRGSRRNIEAHYDLSNEFFQTFLDRTMMYSSAVFESCDATLEEASEAKLERLCRKLQLGPGDHLLEIGSGWGGLAVYAASRFGCRVTTATISPAQLEATRARVEDAGLQDRVHAVLSDYRDLDGCYDKVVSVEMVEAVGHEFLDRYFASLSRLTRPGGLIALQAITIRDQRYRGALAEADFIKKHIFPGSFIPSVSALVDAAARQTDAVLVNLEDIGEDYARTLRAWRERVEAQRAEILSLGFDERFLRMWRFYLAYCEGGFLERAISDVQLLFAKPAYRGQPWRASLTGEGVTAG